MRLLLLPLLGLLLAGCETALDPFEERDRYFTLFGYLDPDADSQFVRVIPLRDTLLAAAPTLDARVTLTDAATGLSVAWQDSLVRFINGRTGHVFWSTEHPASGRTYHLAATRSDGAQARATVAMPLPPPPPDVGEPREFSRRVRRLLRWPEAFHVAELEMVYDVQDTLTGRRLEVVVPYTDQVVTLASSVELVVDVTRDVAAVVAAFELPPETTAARFVLLGLAVRLIRVSDDWAFIAGDVDLETLALPTRFTNVAHGLGFVGAVARGVYPWTLPRELVEEVGYVVPVTPL